MKDSINKNLRSKAEEKLKQFPVDIHKLSEDDINQIFHELQVHQIELEMQNEELKNAQLEIEEQRNKYEELYNFAPVGYITINEKDIIIEANLKIINMLKIDNDSITKLSFTKFIKKEDQDIFYLQKRKILKTNKQQSYELQMKCHDDSFFHAQLDCLPVLLNNNATGFKIAIMDISELKRTQEILQKKTKT